ncbi:MAG TPA: ABC transporter ATP-binding protein [Desulfarculaceae bacterium]|nr:ABC transporter ATP-binding protein [Desulfarculaceae bacterium]
MSLELNEVSLEIDRELILDRVSLKLPAGQSLVVLGNSGAGKSKLLEVVAGLIRNQYGRISFRNRELTPLPPQERGVGFVFQDYALFPHMNAGENILFGLNARKASSAEKSKWLKAVTEELRIDHLLERFPAELSGGQQQRVALARSMVLRPEVLLLDEPLSALDAASRERLALLIKRIQKKYKVTMIYVTHDHNEARFMGDQVLVLEAGKVVQIGSPEVIFARPGSRFVAHFTATRNIFPGRIVDQYDDRKALVEFPGGRLTSASFPESGAEVWVCLRPEHLALVSSETATGELTGNVAEEPACANQLNGYRINQFIPQGGVTVLVELEKEGNRLMVFSASRKVEQKELVVGSEVKLVVAASHVHCLPRQPDDIYCQPYIS